MKKNTTLNTQDAILKNIQLADNDCGSTAVQIYYLTKHINSMNEHFATHKKDFSVQRAVRIAVSKRNKLCRYFKQKYSVAKYDEVVIGIIGLRK